MPIPQSLSSEESGQWLAEQREALRSDWGEAWTTEADDLADDVLSATLASRPGDAIIDLIFWSPELLLPARVSVRVEAAVSAATWEAQGFEVDAYNSSTLGPGLQCIIQRDLPEADGPRSVTQVSYVFTEDEESVVVTAGPTATMVFAVMMPGLHNLLATIEAQHESGHVFSAQTVPGYSVPDAEPWMMETGTALG